MYRKTVVCISLLTLFVIAANLPLHGQRTRPVVRDSTLRFRPATQRGRDKISYLGVPLIVAGIATVNRDHNFRMVANDYAPSFRHSADDYVQYSPAAVMVGLKIAGVRGRSSWGRMAVSDAFSTLLVLGSVSLLKNTTNVQRPDGSNHKSFPSGHTATAFMAATMLHREYGLTRSPWYSIGGYAVAAATGILRQVNNRHWLSDVMAGAGIGMFSTELGYYLAGLIYKERGIEHAWLPDEPFDRYRNPSFLGLYMGFSMLPGEHWLVGDTALESFSGGVAGLEGAWFWNRHWGVGGRLSFSVLPLTVRTGDDVVETSLNAASQFLGIYFSFPVSCRLRLGTKALGGYSRYRACGAEDAVNKRAPGFSTGLSSTYLANRQFGVTLLADYTVTSSVFSGRHGANHFLNLGWTLNVMF